MHPNSIICGGKVNEHSTNIKVLLEASFNVLGEGKLVTAALVRHKTGLFSGGGCLGHWANHLEDEPLQWFVSCTKQ